MDTLLLYDTACPESLHKKIAHLIGGEGITFSSDVLDARHIRPCAGCFKCWIKTPGECHLTRDGTNALSANFVRSRTAILLTRVTWGGYSVDTKAFIDRCIPHLSPFFATLHGEMHHASRYRRYPNWIVIGYQAVNVSEQETFLQLIQRNAINFLRRRPPDYALPAISWTLKTPSDLADFYGVKTYETYRYHQR